MAILKAKKSTNHRRVEKMQHQLTHPQSKRLMNALIDADLLKKFKIKTARESVTMTEVLSDFIRGYIRE
jgi:hypothetical protein